MAHKSRLKQGNKRRNIWENKYIKERAAQHSFPRAFFHSAQFRPWNRRDPLPFISKRRAAEGRNFDSFMPRRGRSLRRWLPESRTPPQTFSFWRETFPTISSWKCSNLARFFRPNWTIFDADVWSDVLRADPGPTGGVRCAALVRKLTQRLR